MFVKIRSVEPRSNLTLLVTFENGEQKYYDVKPLISKWDAFACLQEIPGLFEQVKNDIGGYGISWNDAIDLSCNELWENGTPFTPISTSR